MAKMKYCNDTHQAVVAYSERECPLCVANRRLIEIADAREDIDQQQIQAIWGDLDKLQKAFEAHVKACEAVSPENIWNMQFDANKALERL